MVKNVQDTVFFGNRSSLELLATEIYSGPRRSRAKLCALIDEEKPLFGVRVRVRVMG